jgi:hypothetical protein
MKIRKKTAIKVAVGVLTFLVLIFPFFIMPAFMFFVMSGSGFPLFLDPQTPMTPNGFDRFVPNIFLYFYPFVMCFSFGQLALQVFYLILVVKNKSLSDAMRILFIVGTFFMPFIAMPIYFVGYYWKSDTIFLEDAPAGISSRRSPRPNAAASKRVMASKKSSAKKASNQQSGKKAPKRNIRKRQ